MSGKSKFQISRTLDERIKLIINGGNEYDQEFPQVNSAYVLGFNYGSVTNYVGLTTNYELFNGGCPVVGLAFFRSSPSDDEIKSSLKSVREFSSSPNGLGSFKSDKNEHLFLIYSKGQEEQTSKKIYDATAEELLQEQPKISILDESKIYNHSAIVKLNLSLKLNVIDDKGILSKDKIESTIDVLGNSLIKNAKMFKLHLLKSNFSTDFSVGNKNLTESLYDYLETPSDLLQMGDYLPQMTKAEKLKLIEKWHNKVKSQRDPLEFDLQHEELSFEDGTSLGEQIYGAKLEFYHYLQVNDTITKSQQTILFLLKQQLLLLKNLLLDRVGTTLEVNELKSCTFKPHALGHLVSTIYAIPKDREPHYENLRRLRRTIHLAHMLSLDRPHFRYSQKLRNSSLTNSDEEAGYLCNVHSSLLDSSGLKGGERNVIEGTYTYHHYMQDKINDNGWGCAYRSLQTIISWFKHQGYIYSPDVEIRATKSAKNNPNDESKISSALRKKLHGESRVPNHEEIQGVLVDVGDKQVNFIGSQKWIGSQEVCYVLSHLYDIDSKFISVSSGGDLCDKARELGQHFAKQSTPVMIGGGVLAHTIIGIDFNEKNGDIRYLILDPHYTGGEDLSVITKKGWCGWKKNNFWDKGAFYNLCLPQRPCEF